MRDGRKLCGPIWIDPSVLTEGVESFLKEFRKLSKQVRRISHPTSLVCSNCMMMLPWMDVVGLK